MAALGPRRSFKIMANDSRVTLFLSLVTALLAPERCHGVDTHGSARWDIRSKQGNDREKNSHAGECDWIRGADSVEETGQKTRDHERRADANAYAETASRAPSLTTRRSTSHRCAP